VVGVGVGYIAHDGNVIRIIVLRYEQQNAATQQSTPLCESKMMQNVSQKSRIHSFRRAKKLKIKFKTTPNFLCVHAVPALLKK